MRPWSAGDDCLILLREYQYLTPHLMAELRGPDRKEAIRLEQKNLNRLFREGKVNRTPYLEAGRCLGAPTWVYYLSKTAGRWTLDHELALTEYHIRLRKLCDEQHWDLAWQQRHMAGAFYPDAYFCLKGLHFFLEIERQNYGNLLHGVSSIMRKANNYYAYYGSEQCRTRWNFDRFRVIFQLHRIAPADFISKLEHQHRLYWVGIPGSLDYMTPKDPRITFIDV